jgi:hypothetical protein
MQWIKPRPPALANPPILYEVHNTRNSNFFSTGGGAPTTTVKLAVRAVDEDVAIEELLGRPDVNTFPGLNPIILHPVQVIISPDGGEFTLEANEKAKYQFKFLDITYIARPGTYVNHRENLNSTDIVLFYIEDRLEGRTEMIPVTNEKFVWTTPEAGGIQTAVSRDATPRIYIRGHTLIHIVSGFVDYQETWHDLIGSVNLAAYRSLNLGINYEADSLMLRTLEVVAEWTHNSYTHASTHTYTVICRYEYKMTGNDGKPYGWNRFHRQTNTVDEAWIYDTMETKDEHKIFKPYTPRTHEQLLF